MPVPGESRTPTPTLSVAAQDRLIKPPLRYLSREIGENPAATLAMTSPMSKEYLTPSPPVDLNKISDALLNSRRIFPFEP